MFPSPTRGEGNRRTDFLLLMQDSDSPLPSWERDADTCNDFCSGVGEGCSTDLSAYAQPTPPPQPVPLQLG